MSETPSLSETPAPQSTRTVTFLLQKQARGGGEVKFLEEADSLAEAEHLMDWWVSDSADPEEMRSRMRIVQKSVTTNYRVVGS